MGGWYKGCINQVVWDKIPTMALSICGSSMDAYKCMNADANNAISTDMYEHYDTALSPC
jgi:hypothetical protein